MINDTMMHRSLKNDKMSKNHIIVLLKNVIIKEEISYENLLQL